MISRAAARLRVVDSVVLMRRRPTPSVAAPSTMPPWTGSHKSASARPLQHSPQRKLIAPVRRCAVPGVGHPRQHHAPLARI